MLEEPEYEDSATRAERQAREMIEAARTALGGPRLYLVRAMPSGRQLLFVAPLLDQMPVRLRITTAAQISQVGQIVAVRELGSRWLGLLTIPTSAGAMRLVGVPLEESETERIERSAVALDSTLPDGIVPRELDSL